VAAYGYNTGMCMLYYRTAGTAVGTAAGGGHPGGRQISVHTPRRALRYATTDTNACAMGEGGFLGGRDFKCRNGGEDVPYETSRQNNLESPPRD
jgi:hypothetical protein